MARARIAPQAAAPGLAARRIATDIVDGVLRRRIAFDDQLSGKTAHLGLATLPDRDRALMRRLADFGADSVITDFPGLAVETLGLA